MKVARFIIYDGTEEALEQQLGNSMNEGTRLGTSGVRITCINVSGPFLRLCEELGQRAIEQAYLEGERTPPRMGQSPRKTDSANG